MALSIGNSEALMRYLVQELGFALEVPFGGIDRRRRWRWDAARVGERVAVEYMGYGPGHTYRAGVDRDYRKTSEGQLLGWIVILCNAESVDDGMCLRYVEQALEQRKGLT